jgi:hypothetical protein
VSSLQAAPGELAFTVQITRKATGLVEEVQLIGSITAEQAESLGIASADAETTSED